MKTDKHFKMKPAYKALIALSGGTAESRSHLKHILISAQVAEDDTAKSMKRKDPAK